MSARDIGGDLARKEPWSSEQNRTVKGLLTLFMPVWIQINFVGHTAMKHQIALISATALFAGCASLSKPETVTRIIEVEAPQPAQALRAASFSSNANPKQAAIVCETADMRARALDYDDSNDIVRIMSVQDSHGGSQLLSEVEVDCRDYYLRKSLSSDSSSIIKASTPTIEVEQTRRVVNSRFTYIVQSGDTVWDIAREHCTSVKAISRLNGLGRGNHIDIGQRLKMPDTDCS